MLRFPIPGHVLALNYTFNMYHNNENSLSSTLIVGNDNGMIREGRRSLLIEN